MEESVEYIITADADGNTLSGEKIYACHLPPNIPAKEYWSVLVYDCDTNLIIKNDQLWPSVFRTSRRLVVNQDGSVDVLFGSEVPGGKENNWIQTIPGKGWTMILRLYGTMEACHDQTWRPGKIVVQ